MALHDYLSFPVVSKVCLFFIFRNPRAFIHLHMLVRQIIRFVPLSLVPSIYLISVKLFHLHSEMILTNQNVYKDLISTNIILAIYYDTMLVVGSELKKKRKKN